MSTLRKFETTQRLRAVLGALAPIDVVSVPNGTFGVSASVVITFNVAATQPQKNAANAALASFDWSDAGQEAYEDATQFPDLATLRNQAANAVQSNNNYLAGGQSQAQAIAQVALLTQENTQIIKALGAVILRLTGR